LRLLHRTTRSSAEPPGFETAAVKGLANASETARLRLWLAGRTVRAPSVAPRRTAALAAILL
jgi:hypothetical protein